MLGSNSRRRCKVLAVVPVASVIRFAALPVGAAKATFKPIFCSASRYIFKIVVLPTPGPPVKIEILLLIKLDSASSWLGDKVNSAFSMAILDLSLQGRLPNGWCFG